MNQLEHPVIGFRSWVPSHILYKVKTTKGMLAARQYSEYGWLPGANEAVCYGWRYGPSIPVHWNDDGSQVLVTSALGCVKAGVPSNRCGCGLQAHFTYDESLHYFLNSDTRYHGRLIFGIVKGWGKVMVHPDGWRAQYAEIKAIIPSPNDSYAKQSADFYGVPFINSTSPEYLNDIASEYGKVVPMDLRPEPEPRLGMPHGLGPVTKPKTNGHRDVDVVISIVKYIGREIKRGLP